MTDQPLRRPTGNSASARHQFDVNNKVHENQGSVAAIQSSLSPSEHFDVPGGGETRVPGTTNAKGGVVVACNAAAATYVRLEGGTLYVGSDVDVRVSVVVF